MEVSIIGGEKNAVELITSANGVTCGKELPPPKDIYKWAKQTFLSEHSTCEFIDFLIYSDVRADVCNQIVRHTAYHPRHEVQSQRPDWTGEERPRDPALERKYMGKWNPKALVMLGRQRLCNLAMKETKEYVSLVKKTLQESDVPIMQAMGEVMVPECIYRAGCPYGKRGCEFYHKHRHIFTYGDGVPVSMERRYELYNFYYFR